MNKRAVSAPISPIGSDFAASRDLRRRDPEYAAIEAELAPLEALARILIAYRIEQGLTQEALAQRVGTSNTAICRLESGRHKPSVETLVKIGRALGQKLVIGFEDASGRRDVATFS
ncbi:MAG TPA: helix-turn-helix transcriptional regulator [Terriglobales bacterium]|nr:helix-turn-helix transcriptional regulator [Terriglobales bacterium]